MKKLFLLFVVVGVVVSVCNVAPAALITNVVRSNGTSGDRDPIGSFTGNTQCLATEAGGLKDGNIVFSDRTYPWAGVPAELIGAEYVRTFNTDKGGTGSDTVTYDVTISAPAMVAVTVDDRWLDDDGIALQTKADEIVAAFAAAGTFTDTGLDLFIRERSDGSRDRPMSVFAAQLGPGTYTFGPLQSNKNFYSIGAVPEPATIALLGLGGLVALRRRRR
ncbi:MAG: PEP-CTERM sorting domain-containing protein [Phycisphaerales bacterium]|nr:MAG: PEP-CTERM sorting domain-containing protein [Phycisphaerales bacterium]